MTASVGWHRPRVSAAVEYETLSDAYMLWDTRTWPGGATLYNTGTAAAALGSTWDLTVIEEIDDGVTWQYALKDVGSLSLTPWADIGGPPDSSPITIVRGNGPHPNVDGGVPDNPLAGAVDSPFRFNVDTTAAGTIRFTSLCYAYRQGNPFASDYEDINFATLNTTWRSYTPNGYLDSYNNVTAANSLYEGVVVSAMDTPDNAATGMWINGVAAPSHSPFKSGSYGTNTPTFETNSLPVISDISISMSAGAPAVSSGKWQGGTYVMALHRGVPSAADLVTLQAVYGS
jgi:hypothetical protein